MPRGACTTGPRTLALVRDELGIESSSDVEAAVKGLGQPAVDEFAASLQAGFAVDPAVIADGQFYYPGGWVAEAWENTHERAEHLALLLYYPGLILHDPLAEFAYEESGRLPELKEMPARFEDGSAVLVTPMFGPPAQKANSYGELRTDRDRLNVVLTNKILALMKMAPLIDSEAVALVDQWNLMAANRHPLETSVRHDVRNSRLNAWLDAQRSTSDDALSMPLSWDNGRGLDVEPNGGFLRKGWELRHQARFLYLEKSLLVCRRSGGAYAPDEYVDREFAKVKGDLLLEKQRVGGQFLSTVSGVLLPGLEVTPELVARMRRDEEAFEEWRCGLRTLHEDARAAEDLEGYIRDRLIPLSQQVDRAMRKAPMRDITATAAGFVVTSLVGVGLGQGLDVAAFTGTAASTLLLALWPERQEGANRVLATIVRHRKQQLG